MLSRPARQNASRRRLPRAPTAAETWLIAEATLALAAVALARLFLPTARVQALGRRLARSRPTDAGSPGAVWAVDVAGRLLPDRACVSLALATQALLERRGHRTVLAIDFRREPDGRLAGHARVVERGGGA
jgi:hypothetical protein